MRRRGNRHVGALLLLVGPPTHEPVESIPIDARWKLQTQERSLS